MNDQALTTGQVAKHCQVTYRAVLKWIAEGKLKAYRTPGQHSRVHVKDFVDFLKKYNMPLPKELDEDRRNRRILIIDDDERISDLMRRGLEAGKTFDIRVAHDGFSGGQAFSEFKPDLTVLDINMPGLNGYQVCENIRKDPANKDLKILAVSGEAEEEAREKMLRLGANGFLAKPFEIDVFLKKVDRMLGKEKGDSLRSRS